MLISEQARTRQIPYLHHKIVIASTGCPGSIFEIPYSIFTISWRFTRQKPVKGIFLYHISRVAFKRYCPLEKALETSGRYRPCIQENLPLVTNWNLNYVIVFIRNRSENSECKPVLYYKIVILTIGDEATYLDRRDL